MPLHLLRTSTILSGANFFCSFERNKNELIAINTNALHPILVWGGSKAFAFFKEKELFFQYLQIF
jgi:hypothetical protein